MWKRAMFLMVVFGFFLPSLSYAGGVVSDPDLPAQYKSQNFIIHTKESKKFARQVAYSLETFRKFFLKGFASSQCFGKPLKILSPQVFIFSSKKDFQAFCSQHKKQFVDRNAFFDWWWDAGCKDIKTKWHWRLISFVQKKYEDMQKYIIHELTHIFLNYYLDKIPLWLDEGIATYMQTVQILRGRLKQGRPDYDYLKEYRRAIQTRRQIAFTELMGLDSEQDAKFTYLHYSESWALVHCLLRSRRSVKKFWAFLKDCQKKGEYDKNFQKYFRITPENLQKVVEKYVFVLK